MTAKTPPRPLALIAVLALFWFITTLQQRYQADQRLSESQCSAEEESMLLEGVRNMDVVIAWVNGSEPVWVRKRNETCADWIYHWEWPDEVKHNSDVKRCLAENASLEEARIAVKESCPAEPVAGLTCLHRTVDEVLTAQHSRCYKIYSSNHCRGRLRSIGDHDELRYLVRSIEVHMPWHTGRILLLVPRGHRPRWLKDGGRVQVIVQDDLFKEVLSSSSWIPPENRSGYTGYFPDRTFNDFPIEYSLAFIPSVSRHLLFMQDDLVIAKNLSPCELYTAPPLAGIRVVATPFSRDSPPGNTFTNLQRASARFFSKVPTPKSPYQRPLHGLQMLDVTILRKLWTDWPLEMSASMDYPFRNDDMVDIIGIHHSLLAAYGHTTSGGRAKASKGTDSCRGTLGDPVLAVDSAPCSTVHDMRKDGSARMSKQRFVEITFVTGTVREWYTAMRGLSPVPNKLPQVLSLQDDLVRSHWEGAPELDCLRERWLTTLLPHPSSSENELDPPRLCSQLSSEVDLNPTRYETVQGMFSYFS